MRERRGPGEGQPYYRGTPDQREGGTASAAEGRGPDRPPRKERSDKGVVRGPRVARGEAGTKGRGGDDLSIPPITDRGGRHPNGRKRRRDAGVARGPRGTTPQEAGQNRPAGRGGQDKVASNTGGGKRRQRSDKGVRRGPRQAGADAAGLVGYVSLFRFRHGVARQVPEGMRDELSASPRPWASLLQGGEASPGTHAAGGAPRHRRREATTPMPLDLGDAEPLVGTAGLDRQREPSARRGNLFEGPDAREAGAVRHTRQARLARARARARAAVLEGGPMGEGGGVGPECDLDVLTAAAWAAPGEASFRRALASVGTTACAYE